MAHYSDGKEAKLGDFIEGKDTVGEVNRGILFNIYASTDTCNGRVGIVGTKRSFDACGQAIPWTTEPWLIDRTFTLKDCTLLHRP